MKRHQDIALGIIILCFCSLFVYFSLQLDAGSATMPLILLGIMALLGFIILFDGIKKTRQATDENPVKPFVTFATLKTPFLMFLLIVIYVMLFFFIGYYAATVLFLLTSMRYLKQKSWRIIVIISALFIAFTYFFLVKQLNVSIESLGWLGSWLQMRRL